MVVIPSRVRIPVGPPFFAQAKRRVKNALHSLLGDEGLFTYNGYSLELRTAQPYSPRMYYVYMIRSETDRSRTTQDTLRVCANVWLRTTREEMSPPRR